jgi:hypothetical protein
MPEIFIFTPDKSYKATIVSSKTIPTSYLDSVIKPELDWVDGLLYSRIVGSNCSIVVKRDILYPITCVYRKIDFRFRARNIIYGFDLVSNDHGIAMTAMKLFKTHMPIMNGDSKVYPLPLPNIYEQGTVCTGSTVSMINTQSIPTAIDALIRNYWSSAFINDLTAAINTPREKTKYYIDTLSKLCKSDKRFYSGEVDYFLFKHAAGQEIEISKIPQVKRT